MTIPAFCDAAIHFAQTNVKVLKVTRIITDCISPAARLGLNNFCRVRGITLLCEYPSGMSFVFDDDRPDNWPTVRDFELKFLSDLRSAVSVDSYENVLKAVAMHDSLVQRAWNPIHSCPTTVLCYSCGKVLRRSI